eukprot:scaffold12333_cov117-Isochrysis_galbana.AAC.1
MYDVKRVPDLARQVRSPGVNQILIKHDCCAGGAGLDGDGGGGGRRGARDGSFPAVADRGWREPPTVLVLYSVPRGAGGQRAGEAGGALGGVRAGDDPE